MTEVLMPSGITAEIACARRITVIPITDDGNVITIATDAPPAVTFPTGTKAHPRVPTDVAARRLLRDELRCEYSDLRLVALLAADSSDEPAAVYTARVHWLAGRPQYAGCGRHELVPTLVGHRQTFNR